ncbi:MAG: DNA-directed RNA polymerase subunit beta', partial [Clostridia bacterium]|nr:DNA-directed RNA polymerase subunit beta' [Clostridia bacterium]
MKRLVETGKSTNIKDAKKKVEHQMTEVWDALEVVIREHPVLLNRAPTLHRLSIQAFEPVLVEGRAIKLHPLVCTAFNADFDGDQMPVHVPLSAEAQAEARFLMLSANNLLKPVDGRAVAVPSQDMILGSYYLTMDRDGEKGEGKCFRDFDEAMMAYQNGQISLQAKIKVRVGKEINGEMKYKVIDCTLGKLIFNNNIPQDLGFVDRTDPENDFRLEVEFVAKKKMLTEIVDRCIKIHGLTTAAEVLDAIKATGFKYSTIASLSISVYDMTIPPEKNALIAAAEDKVEEITEYFNEGELDDRERYDRVISTWESTTKEITDALQKGFNPYNPIKMMIDSGARGNSSQLRQLAGLRGLMFATNGQTMEIPIKSNFREGLNILDYFIGARGSRKSLSDTALKTADSGYLTRRLVDVSQEVIVREEDCGTKHGLLVSAIYEEADRLGSTEHEQQVIESLADRLGGRFVIGDVVHPVTGEVIVPDNTMITPAQVKQIVDAGITEVNVRSILRCEAKRGVCAHCYGSDLASGKKVNVGEAVGIIAAQSIGEPGTQLTMRTFHTGGIAGANITQGLPRIEELFEARRPKKTSAIAEIDGTISIREDKRMRNIVITGDDGREVAYPIPFGMHIKVQDGDKVTVGQG